ncbi:MULTISPECIES: hypothetical protein [Acidithiobacillus]|jgi:hypothetical protein|nr:MULTISPECIES: hypothetical protein [Acidithiobacillus]MBE7565933.1 hypothetical protein [Acidithiobacillus sp. HP-11]MBU2741061.1 hypothetical protein [Acidithiobacillus albertensis]MBU2751398.1 hypothetical protein [Acidithiobacillus thiooxidans]MBU2793084.1 hypothetical protein [Acidithiobacillus thiooxidans]MBU2837477.1 hypothetical protein [Acidithiobacillus thiooxidans]
MNATDWSTAFRTKSSIILISLLCGSLFVGIAQAEGAAHKSGRLQTTYSLIQQSNIQSPTLKIGKQAWILGSAGTLSNHMLAEVSGKGVPANLPSVSHDNNSVVLWDEMETHSGEGKSTIETGGANNQQILSITANR